MMVPRFVAVTVNLKDGPCQAYSQDAGTRGSLRLLPEPFDRKLHSFCVDITVLSGMFGKYFYVFP